MIERRFIAWVGGLAIGLTVLGGAVRAADIELDMDLMQTIEDTNKSLASNIAMQDASGSTKDAQELHALFTQVEAHFSTKGDAKEAIDLSRQSVELADTILKSVTDKNFDKAQESATTLSRTCRTCHTFYKKS